MNMQALKFLPLVVLCLFAALLVFWFLEPAPDVGGVGVPLPKPTLSLKDEAKSLKGELFKGKAQPSSIEGNWAQFRGPDLSSISLEKHQLANSWPGEGPPRLWERDLSKGHGGAVIHKGRIFILDYDTEKLEDVIRCLNFENGQEIWRYSYPVKTKNNHGITRSVPAVNDKYLISLGPKGQLFCLDSQSGEYLWSKSLVLEYEATVPKWYSGQCPLLMKDKVIVAPCGKKAFVIQIDCATGEVDWQSDNKMRWEMTHTSVSPMTLKGGQKTYVYSGSGGVAGVSADNGDVLWVNREWKIKIAACASPLVIDEERLFLSAGYSAGCMMIKIFQDSEGVWQSEKVFQLPEKKFGSVQHTPILYKDHIYGTRPNYELVCMTLDGEIKWQSGVVKFGIGPYMMIQDKMFLLDSKSCDLTMISVNPDQYDQLLRLNLWDGHDAYGLMAYSHGILILRDLKKMVALDISLNGYKKIF
ncbi:MAG: PQQ-like beta-propeller repeat protein [Planctomycetes bacterium]|nr:PQQ-like beta-propeller repeat protein [Planctomycetota bacterium]